MRVRRHRGLQRIGRALEVAGRLRRLAALWPATSIDRGSIWSSGRWPWSVARDARPTSARRRGLRTETRIDRLRPENNGGHDGNAASTARRSRREEKPVGAVRRPGSAEPRRRAECRRQRSAPGPSRLPRPASRDLLRALVVEHRADRIRTSAPPGRTSARATSQQPAPGSPPAARAGRASAASAPRDCAARCRCPSRAHRPRTRSAAPRQIGERLGLALPDRAGGSTMWSAPARVARGASRDSRARSVSLATIAPAILHRRRQPERLAARARAQVDHGHPGLCRGRRA